jgi:hypothetical protein
MYGITQSGEHEQTVYLLGTNRTGSVALTSKHANNIIEADVSSPGCSGIVPCKEHRGFDAGGA